MKSLHCSGFGIIRTALLTLSLLCLADRNLFSAERNYRGVTVHRDTSVVRFEVLAPHATRVEVWLFTKPVGGEATLVRELQRGQDGVWSLDLPMDALNTVGGVKSIYYGYRAWGPNWPFTAGWTKGSSAGFIADVDADGNRYNPNKLLIDPCAREVSHDPVTLSHSGDAEYGAGGQRAVDTGSFAPKGIILLDSPIVTGTGPEHAFKDEVIYEVHLRGLTQNDPTVPAAHRGTYAGAAAKATALKKLGITAIEFLPICEFQNDANEAVTSTAGDNYWGYDPYAYFAPDRRYASDKNPGGPTREFQEMVNAFHQAGIKVYIDMVFNHTGEASGAILSMRGMDNRTYYELSADHQDYWDVSGVGGALNLANTDVRNFVVDCLDYWHRVMGVDGFRFDLGVILGNAKTEAGFLFDKMDPANVLNRAVRELPARDSRGGPGVDLIAEPWGAQGGDVYQFGQFPSGWAEWNDHFRDCIRCFQNQLGNEQRPLAELADRLAGSASAFEDDGRKPFHSVNFIVAHDGFTLRDLYSYNQKKNDQPWPFGPSQGGTDGNRSWDQGGDPAAQRQAARTGMILLLVSTGVPMINGGDELYRTQYGNNNPYNLDSEKNWIDYAATANQDHFFRFVGKLIQFRNNHPTLRRAEYFCGKDHDGNGLKDIQWLSDSGAEADIAYLASTTNRFLAFREDGEEGRDSVRSIYVAYNGWKDAVTASLPPPAVGKAWYRVADSATWMEDQDNVHDDGREEKLTAPTYTCAARSALVLVER